MNAPCPRCGTPNAQKRVTFFYGAPITVYGCAHCGDPAGRIFLLRELPPPEERVAEKLTSDRWDWKNLVGLS